MNHTTQCFQRTSRMSGTEYANWFEQPEKQKLDWDGVTIIVICSIIFFNIIFQFWTK